MKKFAEVKAKAEAGDVTSQYTIAVYYEQGFGVPTNSVEAVKWYRRKVVWVGQTEPKAFECPHE